MKYKVYEVEELVTRTGKPYKKCVLKGEGQENSEPRVAVWNDFPDYEKIVAGAEINAYIEKVDSGTPIPAHPNKNYINRTLRTEDQAPKSVGANDSALEERVKKLEAKIFGEAGAGAGSDYPPEEINADDIPF